MKIQNLYKKIFLLTLGSFLILVPFYSGSLSMLLISDAPAEWSSTHTIFLCLGVIFFIGGWAFNTLAKVILSIINKLFIK